MTVFLFSCFLCDCSVTNVPVHINGKKHNRKLQRFLDKFTRVCEQLKYDILLFLFPHVHDYTSLCREIHTYRLRNCRFKRSHSLCKECYFPNEILSYDDFQYYFTNSDMCVNCSFKYVTTSSFLNQRYLILNNNRVMECSEEYYSSLPINYKFDRIADMMRSLQLFKIWNNFGTVVFDLTMLPLFWSLYNFLLYIYHQSSTIIGVVEQYIRHSA